MAVVTHDPANHPISMPVTNGGEWHELTASEVLTHLGTSNSGLDHAEANVRLEREGTNELRDAGGKSPLALLWQQFTAVMVLILLAAAALSLVLGKYLESGSILAIVLLFTLLGFFQEHRAERAIAALKRLAVPAVRVRRQGQTAEIDARTLVPGDIVLLEAGSLVPADLRLIESASLRIQEAVLTGESEPVEKMVAPLVGGASSIGDRRNMSYMGTQVTYGRGVGVVIATGMRTELGRIADLLREVQPDATPLQRRLDSIGKLLAVAGVVIAIVLMGIGLAAGESFSQVLLTAISVAVAVIPEGLPAVVTFTLALGAQKMLRRNALIRRLPAVETLGSVTVICSDKTGTLTENRMTVTTLVVPGQRLDVSELVERPIPADLQMLLVGGMLCNDAEPGGAEDPVLGDPTEAALIVAAQRAGWDPAAVRTTIPRLAEVPFDSERKRMTTVHPVAHSNVHAGFPTALVDAAPYIAIVKGSVDGLLELSASAWINGETEPMAARLRDEVLAANDALAREGVRVLGLAMRPLASVDGASPALENDLTFIGLFGMIDPPRLEAKAAVATCKAAGIRPVMITGDHPLTAGSIARDLGISADATVVVGNQLSQMSDQELDRAVMNASVFARVSPEHKLRIVAALQKQGEVVAMTGDGVNDAPALKRADIGVAMGIVGTDVSKEASDVVLRDDNFATIVAAVEEGRLIYDNLRRFVSFAIAGNIGKVMVMLFWPALFLASGLNIGEDAAAALLPLQLLWLNLMTDGVLGLSMGAEPAEKNIMQRGPQSPSSGIFSGGLGTRTAWMGALIGTIALGVGFTFYQMDQPQWQTMMFTTLAFLQVFQSLGVRSSSESLLTLGLFGNKLMVAAIVVVVGLQLAVLYVPFLANDVLELEPLGLRDLAICVGLGSLALLALECEKLWQRRRGARSRLTEVRL